MLRGKFITFEGPEGSGKTSVIIGVEKYLTEEGFSILTTREPGGIKIAEDIRSIILHKDNIEMDAHAEALLFAASRSQHYHEKIVPALKDNKIILCDRFIDSSLAYQGHARELGIDEVYEINKFAIGDSLPELTLFIDVPPKVGLERVFSNIRKIDRLDLETLQFHEKVYEGYMIIAKKYSDRFKIVDGTQPIEKVIEDAIKIIKNIL
ncbi:MAG: dTMP kinase [Candidatus Izimaplasma sp.]|nr:dTMP kinase [Candidatus Izimaplasma bacterium]